MLNAKRPQQRKTTGETGGQQDKKEMEDGGSSIGQRWSEGQCLGAWVTFGDQLGEEMAYARFSNQRKTYFTQQ